MLKLQLQYFGRLMQRADSLEKTLRLGKSGSRGTKDEMVGQHHRLNGSDFEQAPGDGEGQESRARCRPRGRRVRHGRWAEQPRQSWCLELGAATIAGPAAHWASRAGLP